jgi:hypothetical protein
MLRGSCFYEDFIKTVLTINANWSATYRMVAALVAEPGERAFPNPQAVLDYGEERMRERGKLGFRVRSVIAATRRMLDDGAITVDGNGITDRLSHDYLLGLSGERASPSAIMQQCNYLQLLTQFRSTLIATDRCDHRNGGSICSGRKVDCLSDPVVYRCKAVTIPASVQG